MGNVGNISAKLLCQIGAVITAVSDISSSIHREDDLNILDIIDYLKTSVRKIRGIFP